MTVSLESLIPHRPPMILLSRVVDLNDQSATSEVEISEGTLFFENGRVPAWIGVEYVAQTIAAYSGHLGRAKGTDPAIGFLLGARRYRCTVPGFELGQTLRVHVEPVLIDGDMGSFKGRIEIAGQTVAEVSMTTYKPDAATLQRLKDSAEVQHA